MHDDKYIGNFKLMIPDIFLVALQKYISFLPVYIPYVRTTLRYSQCSLRSPRYLWIFTGSGPKMRLSKQFSIVYYRHQELLINRNCTKRLMFLQSEEVLQSVIFSFEVNQSTSPQTSFRYLKNMYLSTIRQLESWNTSVAPVPPSNSFQYFDILYCPIHVKRLVFFGSENSQSLRHRHTIFKTKR